MPQDYEDIIEFDAYNEDEIVEFETGSPIEDELYEADSDLIFG
jgi:hypothetical protein